MLNMLASGHLTSKNCLTQFTHFQYFFGKAEITLLDNDGNGVDIKKSFSLSFQTRHEGSGLQTTQAIAAQQSLSGFKST